MKNSEQERCFVVVYVYLIAISVRLSILSCCIYSKRARCTRELFWEVAAGRAAAWPDLVSFDEPIRHPGPNGMSKWSEEK